MMAEMGFYGQGVTVGVGVGIDTNNGLTFSFFQSMSAGVSTDVWGSWSVGKGWEGITPFAGIGTPFGLPGIAFTLQKNLINDNIFFTLGIAPVGADIVEVGVYFEAPSIEVPFSNIEHMPGIFDRAFSNPDSPEANMSRAMAAGDSQEAARQAMQIPTVYDDAILRSVAGYGNVNSADGTAGDSPSYTSPGGDRYAEERTGWNEPSGDIGTPAGSSRPAYSDPEHDPYSEDRSGGSSSGSSYGGTWSFGDGDSSNDSDWRGVSSDTYGSGSGVGAGTPQGSGGYGTSENHSVGSTSGYDSRGVYDLDGPEAALGYQGNGFSTADDFEDETSGNSYPNWDSEADNPGSTGYGNAVLDAVLMTRSPRSKCWSPMPMARPPSTKIGGNNFVY